MMVRFPGAECYGANQDLFFPTGAGASEARAMCDACPAEDQCKDYAVETNQLSGIWGNTTQKQRRKLRIAAGL